MAREVAIRSLVAEDAGAIARLHAAAFPGYFLTRLGPAAVTAFYEELASSPVGRGWVGDAHGTIAGFVAGVTASAPFRRGLVRHRPQVLAGGLLRRALVDAELRRMAAGRLGRALAGRAPAKGGEGPPLATVRLLSIAVAPERRGTGLAAALAAAFCERLGAEGVPAIGLSVLRDNPRAVAFYARTGWTVERETAAALYLRRPAR